MSIVYKDTDFLGFGPNQQAPEAEYPPGSGEKWAATVVFNPVIGYMLTVIQYKERNGAWDWGTPEKMPYGQAFLFAQVDQPDTHTPDSQVFFSLLQNTWNKSMRSLILHFMAWAEDTISANTGFDPPQTSVNDFVNDLAAWVMEFNSKYPGLCILRPRE